MEMLNEKEIQFIKETGWTPTVLQMGEYYRTVWADICEGQDEEFCFGIACEEAKEKYGVDLVKLYDKCAKDVDGITLENDAVYLFYTFFSKEELEGMDDATACKWLKDFKYYSGYRKWDSNCLGYVGDAIDVYEGNKEITEEDGNVWILDVFVGEA